MTPSCLSASRWGFTPAPPSGAAFSAEIVSDLPGVLVWKFTGAGARRLFAPEAGGHRWQRVPPTEKRGRTQTSSVTVAVLGASSDAAQDIDRADVRVETYRGTGPGGQHKNKTATAVRLTHRPTGVVVKCESERSQGQNKRLAFEELAARVQAIASERATARKNSRRRDQIGTGYRGDKIRTVQSQNGKVTNHTNGRKCSLNAYLKGRLDLVQ